MFSDISGFLLAWYNLPFTFLFIICIFFTLLQLLGLGDDGHQADHDADLHLDHDLDHDVDLDHDADLDHDVDHDVDHDADHDLDTETHGLEWLSILAFIGIGKAPLVVVLLVLFGSSALTGWILNSLTLSLLGSYPSLAITAVFPLALIAGALLTSRTSRFLGWMLPPISTTATAAAGLVGRRGIVISPTVSEKYGLVRVRDQGGTQINVFATTTGTPIKQQSEVVLVSYSAADKKYVVTAIDQTPSAIRQNLAVSNEAQNTEPSSLAQDKQKGVHKQ